MHFAVLVILPKDVSADGIEAATDRMLAPFNENLEVPPYLVPCECKNKIAGRAAWDYAEAHAPHKLEWYAERYRTLSREKRRKIGWKKFSRAWQRIYEVHNRAHPLYQKVDLECEECCGTGLRTTTVNPQGHWDWTQIGGRYTGCLVDDYDPTQELQNQKWCTLCDGTGNRPDAEYWNDPVNPQRHPLAGPGGPLPPALFGYSEPPAIPEGWVRVEWCNGCAGKGLTVKWPTQWAEFEGDILPLYQVRPNFCPYAIVTPDNLEPRMRHRKRRVQKKWLKRFGIKLGKEGITWHAIERWTGQTWDRTPESEWKQIVDGVRTLYSNNLAVMVDCHG